MRRLTWTSNERLCIRFSKPPMRRLTVSHGRCMWSLVSKPPMRRLTEVKNQKFLELFSKPPMRRLTAMSRKQRPGIFSKPPMRRLTAIISLQCLISCHLAPIILPFTFFLGNHKIPYYNCIHNIWKKTGKNPINICFVCKFISSQEHCPTKT